MSFVEQEDVFGVVENYIRDVVAGVSDKEIISPIGFDRMSYDEALENY